MAIWIITSVAICLFMILIIYQRRPIIKKYLPLTANKNFCLDSGVFLLFSSSGNIEFEFIKNLGLRVIVDKKSFDLCFANISSYHIYPNKIIWKFADNKIVCTADKISLGEVGREFCFDFDKPKFSYNFDTSRRELVLGMEKFRIRLSGFEKLSISPLGNNRLRVKGEINSNACFDFVNKCVVGTRSQVCEFKQKNFAIYDTTRWQFSFNIKDNKSNALKRAYIAKNIKLSARKIEMPQILNFATTALQINFEAKSPIYINLENLGLGKLIQIKLRGCVVTVSDLLTGLSYRIIADKKIISKQICVFGINYLYLSGWNGCVNFTVKPLNQANSEQYFGDNNNQR